MAEGAGIDIVFKVQEGNLVAVVNGQAVALGKLNNVLRETTASTEALADQQKNLEGAQQTVTESSGRLNRSLAGQLTAVSRLQGGVAGLLPQLASWTYLIRRLAIGARGFLSLSPEWIAIAGAIVAVGYAFQSVRKEAEEAYASMKKVIDLRNSLQQEERGRVANQPMTELEASRSLDGKSSQQIMKLIEDLQREEKALADTMSRSVANSTESAMRLNHLKEVERQATNRLIRTAPSIEMFVDEPLRALTGSSLFGTDMYRGDLRVKLQELLNMGVPMSRINNASMLGAWGFMGTGLGGGISNVWDEIMKEAEEQLKKEEESTKASMQAYEAKKDYLNTLRRLSEEALESVRQQELENKLAKRAEERARENQRIADWAGSLTGTSAQWVYAKDWEDRLRQMESMNDRASVEWQLYKLGGQQDAREATIRAYNDMSETDKLAMSNDDLIKTLEEVKKAQEEYNRDAPFVNALERLADKMDKLDETIEDKFSIFEKTWGGENEIESHGGRITNYDPYGGLSYSLNSTEIEKRQLEAQQSIQRSANQIATEGVPVRL